MANSLPLNSMSKAIKRVVRYAVKEGWQVSRTKNNHIRFDKPGCSPVFTGYTPSDRRSELNAIRHLKQSQRQQREGDKS
ncbi:type II toxin-antitoxin system HicA family toxin [Carnimonas bestiolae]|uniref:type II toxin-antitoxin system HicA family toxin n=1 Tax=Carnimonas bestiolae TaxID=3402172 RepID=UPI003EDB85F3